MTNTHDISNEMIRAAIVNRLERISTNDIIESIIDCDDDIVCMSIDEHRELQGRIEAIMSIMLDKAEQGFAEAVANGL